MFGVHKNVKLSGPQKKDRCVVWLGPAGRWGREAGEQLPKAWSPLSEILQTLGEFSFFSLKHSFPNIHSLSFHWSQVCLSQASSSLTSSNTAHPPSPALSA